MSCQVNGCFCPNAIFQRDGICNTCFHPVNQHRNPEPFGTSAQSVPDLRNSLRVVWFLINDIQGDAEVLSNYCTAMSGGSVLVLRGNGHINAVNICDNERFFPNRPLDIMLVAHGQQQSSGPDSLLSTHQNTNHPHNISISIERIMQQLESRGKSLRKICTLRKFSCYGAHFNQSSSTEHVCVVPPPTFRGTNLRVVLDAIHCMICSL